MLHLLRLLSILATQLFRSRRDLFLENLGASATTCSLETETSTATICRFRQSFWVILKRFWSGWKQALILVQPETVVRWHRAGFRAYWAWLSRHRSQPRKRISAELRQLIFRMVVENPTWVAPRIHGELTMLGFDVSERTVLRWMRKAPRSPEPVKRWATFLENHREAIVAMDFFTVPTLTFGVLYCFFVITHDRRRIVHWGITRHPSSAWVTQQLREAFPYDSAPKYLIFDRATNFNCEVVGTIKTLGIDPKRKSFRRPWPNPIAQRWVGKC